MTDSHQRVGYPLDYYHIHWFSLRCFRSSIAITCCAAVYQNRLSKSTASEEKREFHFPYDTCLCKASLTTHTLRGLQFSLITLTSGQHLARVSRIKSRIQFVLAWAQTCKLQSGAKKFGYWDCCQVTLPEYQLASRPTHPTIRHSESVS